MPTPRPIIVARVGPLVGIETAWPASPTRASAAPSPSTAVRIGIPIDTRLPSTRLRISIATRMPMISLVSDASVDRVEPMLPAAATCTPAFWAGSVASMTFCAISVVRSLEATSISTGAKAVCLSWDSSPAVWPLLLSGFVTL